LFIAVVIVEINPHTLPEMHQTKVGCCVKKWGHLIVVLVVVIIVVIVLIAVVLTIVIIVIIIIIEITPPLWQKCIWPCGWLLCIVNPPPIILSFLFQPLDWMR